MKKYSNNQYVDIFNKLPAEIKDVIAASDTTDHLWKIGEKHALHIDKVGIMSDLAFDAMMGIVPTKNFAKTLSEELGISALEGANLARDIDENIFRPIKKSMIDMYGEGAPNKPSSSLVEFYEEESEHPLLKKEDILKEIESPAPVKVRVEEGQEKKIGKIEIEKKKDEEKITALEVYPEELAGKVLDIKEDAKINPVIQITEEPIKETGTRLSDSFAKLVDMKLSQAVVMPKRTEGEGEEEKKIEKIETKEQKIQPELKPMINTAAPITTADTHASTPTPVTPAPAARTNDPYREPIN